MGQFDPDRSQARPRHRLEVVPVSEESEPQREAQQGTPRWQTLIGVVVLAALLVAAGFAVAQIYPNKLPTTKNPSFVDNIFDSRIVILLVRVALIFAAGYVVISVVGLIVGRRWLAELGPFKASEPIAQLNQSAEALEKDLGEALQTIESLEERLLESDKTLAEANGHIGALLDHIGTMEAEKEGN
jgi:hypothetical protein